MEEPASSETNGADVEESDRAGADPTAETDPAAETDTAAGTDPETEGLNRWLRTAGHALARWNGWPLRILVAGLLLAAIALLYSVWPFVAAAGSIGAGADSQPSRLWGAPVSVAPGDPVGPDELIERLQEADFRQAPGDDDLPIRTFRLRSLDTGRELRLHLPARIGPLGPEDEVIVVLRFSSDEVAQLTSSEGEALDRRLYLGAPLLASYYGDDVREILPVELDDLPDHVTQAVLAAEDSRFFGHMGLSPVGIARAMWVNLRSGEVRQGGSTITQQLVKNVFLSHRRTLLRKFREAVLSVVVEVVYSKETILQAYLNQMYLGTGHQLNIHGFGAAARHFFDADASELTVGQAATLAGMIRSPANYSPLKEPEAARERRDQVLRAMAEAGQLDAEGLEAALAEPVEGVGVDLGARFAPFFADAMADEARRRFGASELGNRGYQIFTTLSRLDQREAEEAVARTLLRLPARDRLEGALLSVDPRDGSVLAWVGGRDYSRSQFDRVRLAERQAGSTFKPVVLAAALASGKVTPSTRLDDSPLTVQARDGAWRPANYDGEFRGQVTVRRAIEESINVPTVRLAQMVGLENVRDMARKLGIESRLDPVPSMALGAFEVTPLELTTVYATLAAGGRRPHIHGIDAFVNAFGLPTGPQRTPEPEQVLDPRVVAQTTSILRGVVTSGTARAALGRAGTLAAKTGTSNEARDNWFAAYRPDRTTVVWVGHDEPMPTPLSGARAALPVWSDYAEAAYPPDAPQLPQVKGLEQVPVCRDSGLLPREHCPTVIDELFQQGQAPTELCDVHTRRWKRPFKKVKSWFEDLFDG